MLPRCLAAVAPAVDEIVIVDTGSSDRTIEIAREYSANVIEKEWTGSFSDARNVSFEAATGDWIIYLDADEVLVADDVQPPESPHRPHLARGVLPRRDQLHRRARRRRRDHHTTRCACSATVRTTASRAGCTSRSPTTCRLYAAGRIEQSSVRIDHYGYLGAVRDAKEKSRRNLDLLKAQQAESPSDAFLHFNLGTEYSVIGDYTSALTELERRLEPGPEPGPGGPRLRAGAPAATGHLAAPLRPAERGDRPGGRGAERSPASPTWCSRQGSPRSRSVARPKRSATGSDASRWATRRARFGASVGSGTYLPRIALAELHMRRGELEAAKRAPRLVHRRAPRRDRRDRSVRNGDAAQRHHRPRPWRARSRLASPTSPPARGSCSRRSSSGTARWPRPQHQYRAILAARPNSSQVRVQLAETLLNQRLLRARPPPRQPRSPRTTRLPGWPAGSSCGA